MARSPRSEYVSPHDHGFFKVTCRNARSPLIPLADQSGTDVDGHRVEFIQDLIRAFANFFCISVHSHAVMEREIQLIIEARPDLVTDFNNAEVARRWLKICPSLRPKKLRSCEPTDQEILRLCADPSRVEQLRGNLSDISWFLRLFQQRISIFCNREDDHTGRFWGDRYRCIVLLDDELLQIGLMNVDLGGSSFEENAQTTVDLSPPCPPAVEASSENSAPSLHPFDQLISDTPAARPFLSSCDLSPIRQSESSTTEPTILPSHQHQCSQLPAISMQRSDYLKMLAFVRYSCHESSPQPVPEQFLGLQQRLRLTTASLMALICNFDQLFSHVAGSPEKMAAFITKSGTRRAWVPPATRAIFNARSQPVAS